MTPMQQIVLTAVTKAGRHGVPLGRLEYLLSKHRELRRLDEPKDPRLIVRVTVHQLKKLGFRIADGRGEDRRYRLER